MPEKVSLPAEPRTCVAPFFLSPELGFGQSKCRKSTPLSLSWPRCQSRASRTNVFERLSASFAVRRQGWGLAGEVAGAGGREGRTGVENREEGVAGDEAGTLGNDAEGETHDELNDGSEDGHGGLRAAHEVTRDDSHETGLSGDAANGAAEAEEQLHHDGAAEKGDERSGHVADGEHGARGNVERHAKRAAKLAGGDGAGGPAGFEKAEAARAGMKNVVGESDEDDVGADDACHHDGMRDAESADERLLFEIGEAFLEVGVNGEGEAGFGDFGIAAGLKSFGSGFSGFGKLAGIFLVVAGRNVAAAHAAETKGGGKVGESVDGENSGDSGAIVDKADKCPGDEHAALDTHQDGGVGPCELAGRNDFLD